MMEYQFEGLLTDILIKSGWGGLELKNRGINKVKLKCFQLENPRISKI